MIYVGRFIEVIGLKRRSIISIVKTPPPWYIEKKLPEYKPLAPDTDESSDYILKLSSLDPMDMVNRLLYLTHKKDPIIVCYDEWQINAIIEWLTENGFECERYKRDGDRHNREES